MAEMSPILVVLLALFSLVGSNELPYEEIIRRGVEYTLPELGFGVSELEPIVDEATIRAHHGGHHLTYTNNLNKVLKEWRAQSPHDALAKGSILQILQNLDLVPEKYKTAIQNQGGGYLNHCFYWAGMSGNPNNKDRHPPAKLAADIDRAFGGFRKFKDSFSEKAKSLFGSGYIWLSRDEQENLVLTTTVNQDSPVSQGLRPILVLDVWEHAYYLRHQYRRANYIRDWWKVVDWQKVDALDLWWGDLDNFSLDHRDEL